MRWEQLDEEFAYDPEQLDRGVQTPDQIRTLMRAFRDKLPSEIFPGRGEVPKTLIFAKDDNHAEKIVEIVREQFGKGNEFAQKITYRTTGETPERLIAAFRNSYHPRIAVTVDMIATGTDIKPLEIVMFLRAVKSRTFFEQMKGRGVRVINPADLQSVTPDARAKDRFVIVDCVGVCERDLTDSRPMDQRKSVSLEKLLQAVALGNTEPEVLSSVAARLARLEKKLSPAEQARIAQAAGGLTLKDLARRIVDALSPERMAEAASRRFEDSNPILPRFLNPYAPIDLRHANLPHWRQDAVTYFVTFRLADSLPAEKLRQWRTERQQWLAANPQPWTPEQERDCFERFSRSIEHWLDQGAGTGLLARAEVKNMIADALRYFDGQRYRLGEFVIAANHVHLLVTPLQGQALSALVHSWKSYTAKQILKVEAACRRLHIQLDSGTAGAAPERRVWQKEYYDRIVRNPEELYNIEQYITRHAEYVAAASGLAVEELKRRDAASTNLDEMAREAVKPFCDPALRELIVTLKRQSEQIIDDVTQDRVLEAGFSEAARERARKIVGSFEQFIAAHRDEIAALQILYNRPARAPLKYDDLKSLADALHAPPHPISASALWQAYAALDKSRVRGASTRRILTDLVSLVRYAMHQENELVPYPERVMTNFRAWLARQDVVPSPLVGEGVARSAAGEGEDRHLTDEHRWWLTKMAEHIASNLGIEAEDFELSPFDQRGGLGKVHRLFGAELPQVIEALNREVAA